ncbi:hypothetical protein MUP06_01050 [Patescibacteria group bacterium]|nr:hypothetical protein [Patescibacteria group bacterium]
MPNIEIHGLSPKVSEMLKEHIFKKLFADKPYVKEIVVTIVPSEVTDAKGSEQPFLRILSPDPEETKEILGILERKIPDIDLEYVKIEKFIPKKTVKEEKDRRGPISEFVGDIPVANSYFSGDLTKMTKEQLQARFNELEAADSDDEDSDEAFANRMGETDAIQAELKRRQ